MGIQDSSPQSSVFERTLDISPYPILLVDVEGELVYVNHAARETFAEVGLADTVHDLLAEGSELGWHDLWQKLHSTHWLSLEVELDQSRAGGRRTQVEVRWLETDRQQLACLFFEAPEATSPTKSSSMNGDKRSLEALLEDYRHDLNNLLTTIVANVGVAMLEDSDSAELSKVYSDIEKAAMQARSLTAQLLQPFEFETETTVKAPDLRSARAPKKKIGVGKRVLIVDDEETVRLGAKKLLQLLGFETESAVSGDEAVARYQATLAAERPFDAVLIDLNLADGPHGEETLKELMRSDPGVKAIACSGYLSEPSAYDFKKYGFRGMLAKPYRVEKLRAVLKRVMAS